MQIKQKVCNSNVIHSTNMVGIDLCSGESEVNEIGKVHIHSTFYPNEKGHTQLCDILCIKYTYIHNHFYP